MANLYGRRCRLLIARQVAKDYRTLSVDVIEITDLRVAFKVRKSSAKEPNTAEVTVTNLSRATRSALQEKGVKFQLEAGYEGTGIKRVFSGDVRALDHSRDGASWHTRLKGGDGERAFRHARVSESHAPGAPASDVVRKLADALGLGLGNFDQISTKLASSKFEQGIVTHGPASSELTKVLAKAGITWSIQDGELQFQRDDLRIGPQIPELAPDSGLIGSPEFGSPVVKGGPRLLTFKCLLDADLRPGGRVAIKSERHSGVVRIWKVEHNGDTAGGDWYTQAEGFPSK